MPVEFDHWKLLRHWFADTLENPDAIPLRMDWWFKRDDARDNWLSDTYRENCEAALAGQLSQWEAPPRSRLALILLTDQLPRNLFRGTARAFEGDSLALELCVNGHRSGQDIELGLIERVFFWMPLQHAENLHLQKLGAELYDSLAPADPYRSKLWKGFADYARLHRDIIARFGRFPHRNAALGRVSTQEELDYLNRGGESFGQ